MSERDKLIEDVGIQLVIYAAGMQLGIGQDEADNLISQIKSLNKTTGNNVDYCAGQILDCYNECHKRQFSQALINWLKT